MKNNKKGFTLVELLAVIVILAIIALIATPIILNVIDSARKNAAINSAYGYMEAIEKSVVLSGFSGDDAASPKMATIENGTYTISDNGKTITSSKEGATPIKVNFKGDAPDNNGTITYDEGKVSGCTGLRVNNIDLTCTGSKVTATK